MSRMHDDAIVLARYDYSETSQVLVLLTRTNGKFRVIAKGVKRSTKTRFATGIDLLDVGSVVLAGKSRSGDGLSILTEWKQTRVFTGLRMKLHRLHSALYAAELSARLTEDQDPHAGLFEFMISYFCELENADDPFRLLVRFQCALLNAIGMAPRFDRCLLCGREDDLTHFSSNQGGMVCTACVPKTTERHGVSARTLDVCRQQLPQFSEPVADLARDNEYGNRDFIGPFRLLDYHLSHLMGRQSTLVAKLLHGTAT